MNFAPATSSTLRFMFYVQNLLSKHNKSNLRFSFSSIVSIWLKIGVGSSFFVFTSIWLCTLISPGLLCLIYTGSWYTPNHCVYKSIEKLSKLNCLPTMPNVRKNKWNKSRRQTCSQSHLAYSEYIPSVRKRRDKKRYVALEVLWLNYE